jgi:ribosomal protein L18E
MKIFLILFSIFVVLMSLFTSGYVVYDVIDESIKERKKKDEYCPYKCKNPCQPPQIIRVEVPVPAPAPVIEHIDAEEADALMTDSDAMAKVLEEHGAGSGFKGIANIGDISKLFEPDEIVTLAALKQKGLVDKKVKRIKILADGILDKPLTVKAESFSIQAVKMIELTGGTVIYLIP